MIHVAHYKSLEKEWKDYSHHKYAMRVEEEINAKVDAKLKR